MTTPSHINATDAWKTLELGGGTDEFSLATVRLNLDAGYGPVRVARGPDGNIQLLIPTLVGRRLPDGVSSDAVPVKTAQFLVNGRPQPFIELQCVVPELDAPFRLLLDDVLRRLSQGAGPEQAVGAAVAQFRDLLRKPRSYSLEALVGLFGEFRLLNELLAINSEAASVWTGPLRQRHDFSSRQICAEAKTSLKRDGKAVHISSLEQLEPPSDGRPLVLVHTVLERSGAGGSSVADLIEQAFHLAADQMLIERALQSLQMDGWRSNSSLTSERFSTMRVNLYRVDASFPRVTPESFRSDHPPPGVFGIGYSIDLDHARKCLLDSSNTLPIIRQLAMTS